MVDPQPDDTISITGILDWDSAIFAPRFVSCAPPWWVWAADDEDDGANWDEQDESRALEEPPTAYARELKQLFEKTVGEDFVHYAYKTQYRLARRLFHFAVNGMHENKDIMDADKLFEEWSEWYESALEQAVEEMERMDKESNAETRSSDISLKSETSTIAHEQTPFEEFKLQVKELCHALWPASSKEPPRKERILSSLRAKKVGRFLRPPPPPPPKEFAIERLAGGTFNRVTGITIVGCNGEDDLRLILRVPRIEWESRPDRDVAMLRYVRQHSSIPVADVKAFDVTSNNALKSPYVVQNRLPGTNLHSAHFQLSTNQWCLVAKEVGRTMLAMQGLTNPTPGLIEEFTDEKGNSTFTVCPFDLKSPNDMHWKRRSASCDRATAAADNARILKLYGETTLHFLATQFGRWFAEELKKDPKNILYWDYMHRLTEAASQMNRVCCLGDDQNCLTHLDLAGRNIMAEAGPDDSLTITGYLDWDSAMFVPRFVACSPPWWLWQDEDDDTDYQDDESKAGDTPQKPENQEIKRAFEETVGEDFLFYAYQPQFVLARKLFHIAITGNHNSCHLDEIESFLEGWEAFYKAEVENYVPSEHSQSEETPEHDISP
ncbi:hypothetical protein P7C71_g2438, partial [Lecanoromycetidae sp. Uapishka_2]